MKTTSKILPILLFIGTFFEITISCSPKKDQHAITIHPETDSTFVYEQKNKSFYLNEFNKKGKYYILAKVWGVINFHPLPNIGNINIEKLDELAALNKIQFVNYLDSILKPIEITPQNETYLISQEDSLLQQYTLLNNDWLKDTLYLTPSIALKIKYLLFNLANKPYKQLFFSQSDEGVLNYNNPTEEIGGLFPSKNLRLVGLFHYWNVIYYYYPYKNRMDASWDEVLYQSIFEFMNANNELSYSRAILRLIAKLDDNQSTISKSSILTNIFGTYVPNFRMKKIDNEFVVSKIRAKYLQTSGIQVGDIILKINGINTLDLNFSIQQYASGGNKYSKQREANKLILASKFEKNTIEIERNHKRMTLNVLYFNLDFLTEMARLEEKEWENKCAVVWYPKQLAYLNLNYLFSENFDENVADLRSSKGFILDLRSFHNAGVSHKLVDIVLKRFNCLQSSIYASSQQPGQLKKANKKTVLSTTDTVRYYNPIVIIVDETTQGHAEYVAESFYAKSNAQIIGNSTAGSSGEVGQFIFPGNIEVNFTSVGKTFCDNISTQRTGIKIDTIINYQKSYLQQNRDIMLESALSILNRKVK
jgi:C-terminal processing protease CtpA/Prc